MTRFFALVVVGLMAIPAVAQSPYYARGTFGDPANDMITGMTDPWNDLTHQMVDQGGGHYTATIQGDYIGEPFDYKLANADYSTQAPMSGNGRVVTDDNGAVNFHLWTNNGDPWTDGWYPNSGPRAGYDDPGQFGWEVVGSFNGWPGTGDPNYYLTTTGNGVYTGMFTFPAGSYSFKFREQGNWDVSIGNDFSNTSPDNKFRVWDDGETWTFSLDLPNGRWQAVSSTPTPDLNGDGYVDASDYVLWRKSNGSMAQYTEWRKHFGATPPPPPPGWYARGDFNNWDTSALMTDVGSGKSTVMLTGLTYPAPNNPWYEYKIARSDWSQETPGPRPNPPGGSYNNGRIVADASGNITFYHYEATSWTDGWFPNNQRRVGFEDPHQFGWELMGDFNGWSAPITMHDQTNGLYVSDQVAISATGNHEFKFRWANPNPGDGNDWAINIGESFGNDAPNAAFNFDQVGNWMLELDLPRGAWTAVFVAGVGSSSAVPEPATFALAVLGIACVGFRRRKASL